MEKDKDIDKNKAMTSEKKEATEQEKGVEEKIEVEKKALGEIANKFQESLNFSLGLAETSIKLCRSRMFERDYTEGGEKEDKTDYCTLETFFEKAKEQLESYLEIQSDLYCIASGIGIIEEKGQEAITSS